MTPCLRRSRRFGRHVSQRFGTKNQNIKTEFDPEKYDGATAGIRVFDVKAVVEDMELPRTILRNSTSHPLPQAPGNDPSFPVIKPGGLANRPSRRSRKDGAEGEPSPWNRRPKPPRSRRRRSSRVQSQDHDHAARRAHIKPDAQVGEEIRVELSIPAAFGRMAAQTAKQVIMQRLREAEGGLSSATSRAARANL